MRQSLGVDGLAEAVAARYGVPGEKVHAGPEGGVNTVYFLGDDLVLRVPRTRRAADGLFTEAAIIPAARRGGVLTPAVAEFDATVPYLLTERVRGVDAQAHAVLNPELFEQVGRELAKLHRIAPPPGLPADGSPPDPWALVSDLRAEGRLDQDGAEWLAGWFDRLAPRVPIAPLRVPVHGDVAPQNIMVAGGALAGLVDWGDAMLADPAVDFAKLPLTVVPAALRGYRGINMEPRVLWHHLVWALARLRDPEPSAARHWSAPPASRLLGLLRFFATTAAWRDLV
ncbi:phosphotransferase enzyme family protein [Dactylosporangium sp. CA-233914]|uniref:phosphotransferase enzyme family protein n=1 Tax=Dactylosporangium sp. CA-233914 TaxID=3239934 RepID=UPI003D8E3831